jgi:hypothetical protein
MTASIFFNSFRERRLPVVAWRTCLLLAMTCDAMHYQIYSFTLWQKAPEYKDKRTGRGNCLMLTAGGLGSFGLANPVKALCLTEYAYKTYNQLVT